jgi:hypothetical protein
LNGSNDFGDPGIDGRIILKLMLQKQNMTMLTDSYGLGYKTAVGSCEYGCEVSASIIGGKFQDTVTNG